jgi:hypothetical protein
MTAATVVLVKANDSAVHLVAVISDWTSNVYSNHQSKLGCQRLIQNANLLQVFLFIGLTSVALIT